jgi:APA family basic amino acid/polyamine antiporter
MVVAIIIIGKDIDKIMTFNMFLESLGLALAAATIYYFRKEHDKKLKARWTYIYAVHNCILYFNLRICNHQRNY